MFDAHTHTHAHTLFLQERVKIFLTHCTDADVIKLSKLIEIYTLHSGYLEGVRTST